MQSESEYHLHDSFEQMAYHNSSNVIVEMGQQLIHHWGDKEWLHQVVQKIISKQPENQTVIKHWVELYGKKESARTLLDITGCCSEERKSG